MAKQPTAYRLLALFSVALAAVACRSAESLGPGDGRPDGATLSSGGASGGGGAAATGSSGSSGSSDAGADPNASAGAGGPGDDASAGSIGSATDAPVERAAPPPATD